MGGRKGGAFAEEKSPPFLTVASLVQYSTVKHHFSFKILLHTVQTFKIPRTNYMELP